MRYTLGGRSYPNNVSVHGVLKTLSLGCYPKNDDGSGFVEILVANARAPRLGSRAGPCPKAQETPKTFSKVPTKSMRNLNETPTCVRLCRSQGGWAVVGVPRLVQVIGGSQKKGPKEVARPKSGQGQFSGIFTGRPPFVRAADRCHGINTQLLQCVLWGVDVILHISGVSRTGVPGGV